MLIMTSIVWLNTYMAFQVFSFSYVLVLISMYFIYWLLLCVGSFLGTVRYSGLIPSMSSHDNFFFENNQPFVWRWNTRSLIQINNKKFFIIQVKDVPITNLPTNMVSQKATTLRSHSPLSHSSRVPTPTLYWRSFLNGKEEESSSLWILIWRLFLLPSPYTTLASINLVYLFPDLIVKLIPPPLWMTFPPILGWTMTLSIFPIQGNKI